MSRDVVLTELHRVRHYLEDVGTAATSPSGSVCHTPGLPDHAVQRAIQSVRDNRGELNCLDELWYQLRRPGLLNLLRRCLMAGFVLRQLQQMRRALDVRVGWHPRWEKPARGQQ